MMASRSETISKAGSNLRGRFERRAGNARSPTAGVGMIGVAVRRFKLACARPRSPRTLTANHLVQQNAQAVQVGAAICLPAALKLFGRGIAGRAEISSIGYLTLFEIASNTKIDQHQATFRREDDI